MKFRFRIPGEFNISCDDQFFAHRGFTWQPKLRRNNSFIHQTMWVDAFIIRYLDDGSIKDLYILQSLYQQAGRLNTMDAIAEGNCAACPHIVHFGEFFPSAFLVTAPIGCIFTGSDLDF